MKLFLQVLTAIAAIAVGTVGALAVQSEADSVISAMQHSGQPPWQKVVDDFKRLIDSVEALTDDVDSFNLTRPSTGEASLRGAWQALTVFFKANRDLMSTFMYDSVCPFLALVHVRALTVGGSPQRFTYAHVLAGQIIEGFRRYQAAAMVRSACTNRIGGGGGGGGLG
uniref:Homeobox domain-containing protein n=1 Tax=Ganoderma boninense TaxID=34458 RepID=A0A5K1K004_9APHY|nr:Homeobox domain-containing protein [Ganoderma boninense]